MNSLKSPAVEKALRRLHDEAASDGPRIALGFAKSMGLGLRPHHMKDAYIAVTRGQGQLHPATPTACRSSPLTRTVKCRSSGNRSRKRECRPGIPAIHTTHPPT